MADLRLHDDSNDRRRVDAGMCCHPMRGGRHAERHRGGDSRRGGAGGPDRIRNSALACPRPTLFAGCVCCQSMQTTVQTHAPLKTRSAFGSLGSSRFRLHRTCSALRVQEGKPASDASAQPKPQWKSARAKAPHSTGALLIAPPHPCASTAAEGTVPVRPSQAPKLPGRRRDKEVLAEGGKVTCHPHGLGELPGDPTLARPEHCVHQRPHRRWADALVRITHAPIPPCARPA